MDRSQDITNRSDISLIEKDSLNLHVKEKEEIKEKEPEIHEEIIAISEAISEVSANDYGYFTLKINDDKADINNLRGTKGFLGIINKAIKGAIDLSLKKNNFIDLLNKNTMDMNTGKKFKLVKNDFELLMQLSRDENDYKNFKLICPNEEIYKKMVIF